MPLPSSGTISISQINAEVDRTANFPLSSLNDAIFRLLSGKETGTITMSDFYGKSLAYKPMVASGGNSV